MAINIDVITGFLESGKTNLIKQILELGEMKEFEKILLLVLEEGIEEYEVDLLRENNIICHFVDNAESFTNEYFRSILEKEDPEYILIEYNGTRDINNLIKLNIKNSYKFRNIIHICDGNTFSNYLSNMSSILVPQILNSDICLINRYEKLSNKEKKRIRAQVKGINGNTKTVFFENIQENKKLKRLFLPFETYQTITPGMVITLAVLLCLCFFPTTWLQTLLSYIQTAAVSFLSIIIQAIPFILLGAFISSTIQILMPKEWILDRISRHNIAALFLAGLAGFFLPVCDCGLVPLINGLLKKKTPLPQVMTFWLCSAALNPIVLLSVFYAFPDKHYMVVLRVVNGLIIGYVVGFILMILQIKTDDVIKQTQDLLIAGGDRISYDTTRRYKLTSILTVARIEFFRVFRYVIIGAFISSMCLAIMPPTFKNVIGSNAILGFLLMIGAAVFLSTCSTSNAFIARGFYNSFSLASVLSFMVLGPMLDFKNLIVLSDVLKTKFLIQLISLTIVVGLCLYGIVLYL